MLGVIGFFLLYDIYFFDLFNKSRDNILGKFVNKNIGEIFNII